MGSQTSSKTSQRGVATPSTLPLDLPMPSAPLPMEKYSVLLSSHAQGLMQILFPLLNVLQMYPIVTNFRQDQLLHKF